MIFVIGLAMIVAGWVAQVYKTSVKKHRDLSLAFLLLYAIGCVLLLSGNFLANDISTGVLNTICVILAITLLITLIIQKKTA